MALLLEQTSYGRKERKKGMALFMYLMFAKTNRVVMCVKKKDKHWNRETDIYLPTWANEGQRGPARYATFNIGLQMRTSGES